MSFGDGAGWGGDTSFATETSGKVWYCNYESQPADQIALVILIYDYWRILSRIDCRRSFPFLPRYHISHLSQMKNSCLEIWCSQLWAITLLFSLRSCIQVYTIGDIKEVLGEPSARQYRLVDPQDQTSTFLVTNFDGQVWSIFCNGWLMSCFQSEDGNGSGANGDISAGTRVFVCGMFLL